MGLPSLEVVENKLNIQVSKDNTGKCEHEVLLTRVTTESIDVTDYLRLYDGLKRDIKSVEEKLKELKEQKKQFDEFIDIVKQLDEETREYRQNKINELIKNEEDKKNNN